MGIGRRLHEIAVTMCEMVSIPGPPSNISMTVSLTYIEMALQALEQVIQPTPQNNLKTLLTWLKSFIFSFVIRRTQ